MARRTAPNRSISKNCTTSFIAAKVELSQIPSTSYPRSAELSAFRIKNASLPPPTSKQRNQESSCSSNHLKSTDYDFGWVNKQ